MAAHQGCGPRVGQQQRQPKGIAVRPEKKQTTMGIGSRQHNPQLPIPPQKKIPPTGQFLPLFTPHSKTHTKKVDGEGRETKGMWRPLPVFFTIFPLDIFGYVNCHLACSSLPESDIKRRRKKRERNGGCTLSMLSYLRRLHSACLFPLLSCSYTIQQQMPSCRHSGNNI